VIDNNVGDLTWAYGMHLFGHFNGTLTTIKDVLIRKNVTSNVRQAHILLDGSTISNVYIVHNTFFNKPAPVVPTGAWMTSADNNGLAAIRFGIGGFTNSSHIVVKNNIGAGTWPGSTGGLGYPVYQTTGNIHTVTAGGLFLDYNLWYNIAGSTNYNFAGSLYTLAQMQSNTIHEDHSKSADPVFTNTTPGSYDFTLQGSSPAIDAGQVLTTTTGACSGNTVVVADAGYFFDGFGLVTGDTVQIGSITRVLTGVNLSTNTLTWTGATVTCSSGTEVSLPYAGSAPDMGAKEYIPVIPNHLTFTTQPVTTVAGSVMPSFTVQVQDSGNALVTSAADTVTIALLPSGGVTGTLSKAAVAGVATFTDIVVGTVGTGYTLTATASGLTSGVSSPFDILSAERIISRIIR
jgi:hypothetical protein